MKLRIDSEDVILLFIVISVCVMFRYCDNNIHTYLVKRLDTQELQRYQFSSPCSKGDTVTIYDEIQGPDGPISFPTTAVVIDTML